MKLRYSPRAKADITAIHAYIAEHNPKAAKSVIRKQFATSSRAIQGLAARPISRGCLCFLQPPIHI